MVYIKTVLSVWHYIMVRFYHCSDALFSIYQYMKIGPGEFKINMTQLLCYLLHGTKHLQRLYGIACA